MNGFYELECLDWFGFSTYYYFYSHRAISNLKTALNRGCAPDGMRIVVDDREDNPIKMRPIHILNTSTKSISKKQGLSEWVIVQIGKKK